ncbi:methyltransferase domain-containing protein [Sutcliffiella halmapala]|uniref:methyltransferase domain-containing protein n=1 Tax=Sutcliffiella halmapala TaxID=79882 RepID=UPI000994DD6C|nr:methyltransferase domain-containing protein [Sutcliffiella halmapala]
MNERNYEELLNINTTEKQKGFHPSFHYHRYEPTPYLALQKLLESYELKSSDRVVDFGCGKGRLNFFLHYEVKATVVGIEMDETFYQKALDNREHYFEKYKAFPKNLSFISCLAEEYDIHPLDNRFYFFNPFTVQIFRNVIDNILLSVEQSYRHIELILYYPSADYLFFLENHPSFELKVEVPLPSYEQNMNERIVVYQLTY